MNLSGTSECILRSDLLFIFILATQLSYSASIRLNKVVLFILHCHDIRLTRTAWLFGLLINSCKLKLTSRIASDANQVNTLKTICLNSTGPKLSGQIYKNAIISEYNVSCQKRRIKEKVTTRKKGEPNTIPTTIPTSYLTIFATRSQLHDEAEPESPISGQELEARSRNYQAPQVF